MLLAHHACVNNLHGGREITRRVCFIENSERAARVQERKGGIRREGREEREREGGEVGRGEKRGRERERTRDRDCEIEGQ